MLSIKKRFCVFLAVMSPAGFTSHLQATYHLMQIEQVIAGVDGDTSAQAIQLRMRFGFQNVVAGKRLIAYDAQGLNPVVLLTIPTNVGNGAAGARILLATSSFASHVSPSITPDFILTNAIPASYLAAGSLTFVENTLYSTVWWWRLSWGGTGYTGPKTGSTFNDVDGDYGRWPGSLPSSGIDALQFQGVASALSTTNAADYSLTSGGAVFTNNVNSSGTVQSSGGPLPCPADCSNGDGSVNVTDLLALLAAWGQVGSSCDIAGVGDTVNVTDLLALLAAWGSCP
ncbi:MAG: hypothetical protein IH891_10890 [Planctomycetes bacterium]|nr:hypothetical protein [Planctomycetota bacterium]